MNSKLLRSSLLGVALPAQEQEGTTVSTTLSQIRHEPEAFKNVQVELTVQFVSLGRIANPFFTKFTPTDYVNVYVWGDEQPIWRPNAYEDVCGTLFLSKESEQFQQLYSLKLYQRLKVTAVVRNTFQNTPWTEVVSFSPLPAKLDTGVLTHLYRGEKLMAERQWQRAIAELQRVPGNSVPETALAAAYSNLCTCMLRIGEADKAVPFLQSASALTRGNGLQIEAMLETAKGIPAKEIDRTVNVAAVQDSNRPMWEAFDAGKGAKTPQTGNPVAALAR